MQVTACHDRLSKADLKELIAPRSSPCVTIYLPTHRAGREIRQDPIRLKNLLREAEHELVEQGVRSAEARRLLEPARGLIEDAAFWRLQNEGLALFLTAELTRSYRLPLTFEEFVEVGDRFHVNQLLPYFVQDGRFYILAVSPNDVRLLQATRHTVNPVELPDAPPSLTETPGYEKPETQLQLQVLAPPGSSGSGIVHGHGSSTDVSKDDLIRYLRHVDKAVSARLADEEALLVLAGVESLFPIYREVTAYRQVLEDGVRGNPEGLRDEELVERAWPMVEPVFQRTRRRDMERFQEALQRQGAASDKLEEVLAAAWQGRMAVLFVPLGVQRWGAFDPATLGVCEQAAAGPGDQDLLNLAAVHTIVNNGRVYALPAEAMPVPTSVAALFRY